MFTHPLLRGFPVFSTSELKGKRNKTRRRLQTYHIPLLAVTLYVSSFTARFLPLFRSTGLCDCDQRTYFSWDRPELQETANALMLRLNETSLKGIVGRGGMEGLRTEEDVEEILQPIRKQVKEGMRMGFGARRVWGRKPA